MSNKELKVQARFTIKVVTKCNKAYSLYLPKYSYFTEVDGQLFDCKHYARHDTYFINFADKLELELFAANTNLDIELMAALNKFNTCEDVESYHASTLLNFLTISTGLCTMANLALYYMYNSVDKYSLPICLAATSYEIFHLSQTHCPDQLRFDLIGNLTRWSEE
jgi:hypothetical protein